MLWEGQATVQPTEEARDARQKAVIRVLKEEAIAELMGEALDVRQKAVARALGKEGTAWGTEEATQ